MKRNNSIKLISAHLRADIAYSTNKQRARLYLHNNNMYARVKKDERTKIPSQLRPQYACGERPF